MADAASPPEKKDMLFSQGAHEIRNLVSVLVGYARMLADTRLGPLTDAQRDAVTAIGNSNGRLREIADDMSTLARLLAGGVEYGRSLINLSKLLAGEIPSLMALPDRHVALRVIDQAPSATVAGDATALRTTFNSLMYSYRRELVTSDELCIAIDRDASADRPTLRVTIAGADRLDGVRHIPTSELAPLVEFRSGMGYRLSVARRVIEAHNGQVFSKIEPGPTPNSSESIVGAVVLLPEADAGALPGPDARAGRPGRSPG